MIPGLGGRLNQAHPWAFRAFRVQSFMKLFTKFLENRHRPPMDFSQVEPLSPSLIVDFDSFQPCPADQVRRGLRELLKSCEMVRHSAALVCLRVLSGLEARAA